MQALGIRYGRRLGTGGKSVDGNMNVIELVRRTGGAKYVHLAISSYTQSRKGIHDVLQEDFLEYRSLGNGVFGVSVLPHHPPHDTIGGGTAC